MRTPAGKECKYFYGDYYRGRNREECELLGSAWTRSLCTGCPIPAITRANACETMQLSAEVIRPLGALFQKRVKVTVKCEKTRRSGFDPHIGCGECHPVPPVFQVKE
jgi:hypothetical protein